MFLPQDQPIAASEGGCPGAPVTKKQGGGPEASIASKNRLHYLTSPRFPRSRRLAGFPQPADHTPSGRPRPAPPALRSVPLPLHSASLTSLRSWRLPGLLLLSGISDDHDRLGTRRSSSAGSARRAVLRHRASSRPLGGGQSVAIGPGRRDRQVSLRPVMGSGRSPQLRSKRGDSRCAARPRRASEGARDSGHREESGRRSAATTGSKESRPSAGHVTITSGEILSGPSHSPGRTCPPSRHAVFLHGSRR